MVRFGELLRALHNLSLLAAIGRSGGELSCVADLVDSFMDSPQMADCVRRFRALPDGAAMLTGRYPPLNPDIDQLSRLPQGTLGQRYAQLILQLGYDPSFFRQRCPDRLPRLRAAQQRRPAQRLSLPDRGL